MSATQPAIRCGDLLEIRQAFPLRGPANTRAWERVEVHAIREGRHLVSGASIAKSWVTLSDYEVRNAAAQAGVRPGTPETPPRPQDGAHGAG